MLLRRHVYSSWYFLASAAILVAFSSPKWLASCFAMDSVESKVPYASNARMISFFEDIVTGVKIDASRFSRMV